VIEAMASLPAVCEQVHLPVQVGDDVLLKRMNRGYTLEQYRTIVHKLRAAMPDIAITTDLMLGFPGETEEQVQNTLDFVEEIRFDQAFMFIYSPRHPTPAAKMPDQIPQPVKVERLERLIAIQNRIVVEKNNQYAAERRIYDVLVEGASPKYPGQWHGLTRGGKTVNFDAHRNLTGQTVKVRALEGHLWGFMGELV
jgi:tRNA-2-methylthio-N6-dimethylallyladenosine synthase